MEKINGTNNRLTTEEASRFESGVVETVWSEAGEPHYIIKDGLNVKEYASLAKKYLENERIIAHDFTSHVINGSGERVDFEYKSGWFLEGLAEQEME
ncbi:hypothetical protein ACTJKN_07780 [Pedobacter sp. 22163]|uniref:hypothetical protein n=1 Tax=Pedobacter sp. 22163 TaxID=3453883 RepID=UPI003F84A8EF